MTSSVVRAGVDTWVWATKPKKNFNSGKWLRVALDAREGLIRLKSPVPKNATVLEAKLVLQQVDAVSGAHNISARRVTEKWNVNTVTWDRKPPAGGVTASVTKTGPAADAIWELDVTTILQAVANGEPNYGIRLTSSNGNEIKFHSMNSSRKRPYLRVTWTTRPDAPTLLQPAFGAVTAAKPILTCDYSDRSGSTDLTALQVQIDPENDFTGGIGWDSGTVPVDVPSLDLAATSYPGLAAGATTYWRVRVQDGDGLWSDWSDSAPISRIAKGTLSITNPAASPNDYVSEFTPPIVWSFSLPQTHAQVRIAPAANPKKILHDSGKILTSVTSYTVPKDVLSDNEDYRVTVRAWDNVEREATPGDPVYVEATRDFAVAYDATVTPPSSLAATVPAGTPWVDLTFARGTAPDTWTVLRDGIAIETDLETSDLTPGPGIGGQPSWIWRDLTARPEIEHTYQVLAEVNGKLSAGGPTAVVTTTGEAIWLADPVTGATVVLGGLGFDTTQEDYAETYAVIGSTEIVRSVMGLNGLSGSIDDAWLRTRDGYDWQDLEATIYDFKSRPADQFRLVLADLNIPVVLGNVKVAPAPSTMTGQVIKAVSFTWWQTGEHPFTVRV